MLMNCTIHRCISYESYAYQTITYEIEEQEEIVDVWNDEEEDGPKDVNEEIILQIDENDDNINLDYGDEID